MKNIFFSLLLPCCALFLIASCGDNKITKEKKEEVNTSALPSISFEEMKDIYETCDFVDFIFYEVDFSMSIKDKNNIQRTLSFATPTVATPNPACKAMGRVFFQRKGEVLTEADMYLGKGCNYFIFHKDGKPTYANTISPQGQAYFAEVFSKVKIQPAAN